MSRGNKKLVTLLLAGVVAFFVWLDKSQHSQRAVADGNSVSASSANQNDRAKYHNKTFTVVKVVDGDTLDVDMPDGKYKTTRIRLLGVDTPETKKPNTPVMYYGPEASDYTRKITLGKKVTVLIDTVSDERDRFGRLLGYIRLEDGRIVNEMLVEDGYAYADLRFKHSDFEKYRELMEKAKVQKKGLWKDVQLKDMPGWMQKIKPTVLKKAA
jgi:micrococcal nuclease